MRKLIYLLLIAWILSATVRAEEIPQDSLIISLQQSFVTKIDSETRYDG